MARLFSFARRGLFFVVIVMGIGSGLIDGRVSMIVDVLEEGGIAFIP